MATPRRPVRTTVGSAMPVGVPPLPGSWRSPTRGPVIPQQRRPDRDPGSRWPAAPQPPRHARRLTWLVAVIAAFATVVAVGLVLGQSSDDRAVSRSTGLTELLIPPALTAAESVREQPVSLAEVLLGRGPGGLDAAAAGVTDLEELLLRPGMHASSPTVGNASELSWWVVLQSAIKQPQ
jgi:hypothetical protein